MGIAEVERRVQKLRKRRKTLSTNEKAVEHRRNEATRLLLENVDLMTDGNQEEEEEELTQKLAKRRPDTFGRAARCCVENNNPRADSHFTPSRRASAARCQPHS